MYIGKTDIRIYLIYKLQAASFSSIAVNGLIGLSNRSAGGKCTKIVFFSENLKTNTTYVCFESVGVVAACTVNIQEHDFGFSIEMKVRSGNINDALNKNKLRLG